MMYLQKDIIRITRTVLHVVPEGVEPSTLALLAPHSNQLSYGTLVFMPNRRYYALSLVTVELNSDS